MGAELDKGIQGRQRQDSLAEPFINNLVITPVSINLGKVRTCARR